MLGYANVNVSYISFNLKAFKVQVSPEMEDDIAKLTEPLVAELKSDVEIINKSADLMSTVGLYTRKIEVLHPGNSSTYHRLNTEFAVTCY